MVTKSFSKIDWNLSLKEISKKVMQAREIVGNQKRTVSVLDQAIDTVQDFIVNLYLEKASLFQLVYMEERDKLDKGNRKLMKLALKNLEEVVDLTQKHVTANGLDRWQSRVNRFYGRVRDYQEKYDEAIDFYKRALKFAKVDPEYKKEKTPRWLEYEAFIAYDVMKIGQTNKGLALSRALYNRFATGADGKFLKRKDYTTWAIWRTGVAIRAVEALINSGKKFDKKDALSWLAECEEILNPPKSIKTWADFKYRKNEIEALRKQLNA